MNTDLPCQQLHVRAARGDALSQEERTRLDAWYARLDQEEAMVLAKGTPPERLSELQAEIDRIQAQLATVSQRVQTLSAENAAVGREIASLQTLLAQKLTSQPA